MASDSRNASISLATLPLLIILGLIAAASSLLSAGAEVAGTRSNSVPANGTRGDSRDRGWLARAEMLLLAAAGPSGGYEAAILFSISARVCVSRSRMRFSSSATRAWI